MTFHTPLETSIFESVAQTLVKALFNRHGGASNGKTRVSLWSITTILQVVFGTSDTIPFGNILLDKAHLVCAQDPGRGLGAGLRGGSSGALLNGVASWKGVEYTINVLIDTRWFGALLHLVVGQELEVSCAIFNHARVLRALVNGALECVDIPTIKEIYGGTRASWVTRREHKGMRTTLPPLILPRIGIPNDLVKYRDQTNGVGRGADAIVHSVRIGHMGLVVGRIEVNTIPAGREEDLGAQTIGAVGIRDAGSLGRLACIVETDKGNGLLAKRTSERDILGIIRSQERVSGEHLETRRKWMDHLLIVGSSLEVVNGRASNLLDSLKLAIRPLVKQGRGPIIGTVFFGLFELQERWDNEERLWRRTWVWASTYLARSAGRSTSSIKVLSKVESRAPHDSVNMTRDSARVDNSVFLPEESPKSRKGGVDEMLPLNLEEEIKKEERGEREAENKASSRKGRCRAATFCLAVFGLPLMPFRILESFLRRRAWIHRPGATATGATLQHLADTYVSLPSLSQTADTVILVFPPTLPPAATTVPGLTPHAATKDLNACSKRPLEIEMAVPPSTAST
ncbi:17608_t:CDS:2, partial [Acaulospora colombiana]